MLWFISYKNNSNDDNKLGILQTTKSNLPYPVHIFYLAYLHLRHSLANKKVFVLWGNHLKLRYGPFVLFCFSLHILWRDRLSFWRHYWYLQRHTRKNFKEWLKTFQLSFPFFSFLLFVYHDDMNGLIPKTRFSEMQRNNTFWRIW